MNLQVLTENTTRYEQGSKCLLVESAFEFFGWSNDVISGMPWATTPFKDFVAGA